MQQVRLRQRKDVLAGVVPVGPIEVETVYPWGYQQYHYFW